MTTEEHTKLETLHGEMLHESAALEAAGNQYESWIGACSCSDPRESVVGAGMSAAPVLMWTRRETRNALIDLATRTGAGESSAANTARSIVPIIAAECCPNALKVFFDRLVPAIRDRRTGSADVALEELLGGDAA